MVKSSHVILIHVKYDPAVIVTNTLTERLHTGWESKLSKKAHSLFSCSSFLWGKGDTWIQLVLNNTLNSSWIVCPVVNSSNSLLPFQQFKHQLNWCYRVSAFKCRLTWRTKNIGIMHLVTVPSVSTYIRPQEYWLHSFGNVGYIPSGILFAFLQESWLKKSKPKGFVSSLQIEQDWLCQTSFLLIFTHLVASHPIQAEVPSALHD